MTNEWRNRAGNAIRDGFRVLTLIIGFCFVVTNSSNVVAAGCGILELSTVPLLPFADISETKLKFFNDLCKKVEDGNMDVNLARRITHGSVLRYAACRDNRINLDYEKHLKEEKNMPATVVLANEHFCHNTFDPSAWDKIKHKELLEQVDWLRTETFCNSTREFLNPSGFWRNLFMPDLPSLKTLTEETDLICRELRKGDITYNDAVYRWRLAFEENKKRFGPELVEEAGKDLVAPIQALLDLYM